MAPFAYSRVPIEKDGNEARLVHLLPAAEYTAELRCALITSYLDHSPKYEALSFTWGDEGRKEPLPVNGKELLITSNWMSRFGICATRGMQERCGLMRYVLIKMMLMNGVAK